MNIKAIIHYNIAMKSIKKENKIIKMCVKCYQNFTPIQNHHDECIPCYFNHAKNPLKGKCLIDLACL